MSENKKTVVSDKIAQIINKASGMSNFIFRGENENYQDVSSSLYREHLNSSTVIEKEESIFKDLKSLHFTPNTSAIEVLAQLQHRGGETNLIDFTENVFIALFFSCSEDTGKDGRIIFLKRPSSKIVDVIYEDIKKEKKDYVMFDPKWDKTPRVVFQSSVFIYPTKGFIPKNKYSYIKIEASIKKDLLLHLEKIYGIKKDTVYNDLEGFIRNRKEHLRNRKEDSDTHKKSVQASNTQNSSEKDENKNQEKRKNW